MTGYEQAIKQLAIEICKLTDDVEAHEDGLVSLDTDVSFITRTMQLDKIVKTIALTYSVEEDQVEADVDLHLQDLDFKY